MRQAELRAKLRAGRPTAMLTLTWRPSQSEAPAEARDAMAIAWNRMVARIRRRWGKGRFEFGSVVEATQAGWPHFHILLRGPFLPQRWLSQVWQELTGARIVDIRKIKNERQAAQYVTKYVTKEPARWGNSKRYWFSREYVGDEWKQEGEPVFDWSEAGLSPENYKQTCAYWRARGYRLEPIGRGAAVLIAPGYEATGPPAEAIARFKRGGPRWRARKAWAGDDAAAGEERRAYA